MLGLFLSRLIEHGTLTVIWRNGTSTSYGKGEPHATIRFHNWSTPWLIALRPDLFFGEAYMSGQLTVENCTIADVLEIALKNLGIKRPPAIIRIVTAIRRCLRPIMPSNAIGRAKDNVAHHYDLSGALYDLFLDLDRQYSCAYFESPGMTLEAAQLAKKRHIATKLRLDHPELSVLDVGSGWGGLALELARDAQANVLGITLSSEQLILARERADRAGLSARCEFELKDYRDVTGSFERIVSVGMFEHVGLKYYDIFFQRIRELLTANGVALLHTIGRTDGPGITNPWADKYIFPGAYSPALSEVAIAIERSGLFITDIEVLRLHYAETLKEWRARFEKNRVKAAALYDQRFCRMWEFYLASSEMCFRYDHLVVFQIQLVRQIDALPITRDYMLDPEKKWRGCGRS